MDLERVADWIVSADGVVALTGAGVSTASGVPDFRGPQGVWTKDPAAERLSNIDSYVADADVRREVWRRRVAVHDAVRGPNPAHFAFVELERAGCLSLLVTQNVDGLHSDAGSSRERLVEIHGTAREVQCLSCGDRVPAEVVFERVMAGEDDPSCRSCGGILKSATVSFGQSLAPDDVTRAHEAALACDVLLAVGTSLVVYPVAALPQVALDAGARLVVINQQATPYDARADVVVREDAGTALTWLVEAVVERVSGPR